MLYVFCMPGQPASFTNGFMPLISSPKATSYRFKVGDVVYAQNGGATFYRVIKRTKCMVTLETLQKEAVSFTDGYGQSGYEVPLNIPASKDPRFTDHAARCPEYYIARTKIKVDDEGNEEAFIGGNWYQHVRPYDGQPKPYDIY